MAPRWIPTKEHSPGLFPPNQKDEDDWLLVSGGWVVGRVVVAAGHRRSDQFNWSLTGPKTPEAPVAIGGTETGAEAAKAALLASWRAWRVWAGMPEPDLNTGMPWSELADSDLRIAVANAEPIADTARFLCRTEEEVRARAAVLGLVFTA